MAEDVERKSSEIGRIRTPYIITHVASPTGNSPHAYVAPLGMHSLTFPSSFHYAQIAALLRQGGRVGMHHVDAWSILKQQACSPHNACWWDCKLIVTTRQVQRCRCQL